MSVTVGNQFDFCTRRQSHAPRAAKIAFEQDLCAESGGADCICEMYGGHTQDRIRTYRHLHNCECGRSW